MVSSGSWMPPRRNPSEWAAKKDSGGGPLWSPDGKLFAFQGQSGRKRGGFVCPRDQTALKVTFLTVAETGTNSPLPGAGKGFYLVARRGSRSLSSPRLPGGRKAGRRPSGDPMVITRYLYKPDAGEGMTRFNDNQRGCTFFVVDVATKTGARQLTQGKHR